MSVWHTAANSKHLSRSLSFPTVTLLFNMSSQAVVEVATLPGTPKDFAFSEEEMIEMAKKVGTPPNAVNFSLARAFPATRVSVCTVRRLRGVET